MTSTTTRLFALALLLLTVSTTAAQAQDLAPELQFGARGVVSGNVNIASGQTTSAVSDFSDTALLVGARQKLFHDARGQLVIGLQFPDAESNLGQVFFHRVFVHLENQRNAFQIGRTRLSSTLVEFPTLRDDDALLFTDVVSPFSDGEDSEDSQFGNVIEAMRFLTPHLRLEFHGEHYTETNAADDFSLNAAGALARLPRAGEPAVEPESARPIRRQLRRLLYRACGLRRRLGRDAQKTSKWPPCSTSTRTLSTSSSSAIRRSTTSASTRPAG